MPPFLRRLQRISGVFLGFCYGCSPAGEFRGPRFSANNLYLQCENKMATEHGQSAGLQPHTSPIPWAHLLFDLCFPHSKNSRWFFCFHFHRMAKAVNSEKHCAKYCFQQFLPCSYLSQTISSANFWVEGNYLFRPSKQMFIDLAQ